MLSPRIESVSEALCNRIERGRWNFLLERAYMHVEIYVYTICGDRITCISILNLRNYWIYSMEIQNLVSSRVTFYWINRRINCNESSVYTAKLERVLIYLEFYFIFIHINTRIRWKQKIRYVDTCDINRNFCVCTFSTFLSLHVICFLVKIYTAKALFIISDNVTLRIKQVTPTR